MKFSIFSITLIIISLALTGTAFAASVWTSKDSTGASVWICKDQDGYVVDIGSARFSYGTGYDLSDIVSMHDISAPLSRAPDIEACL